MTDIERPIDQDPIAYFRNKVSTAASRTHESHLRRAVDSFSEFLGGTEIGFEDITETLLGEYVSDLLYNGYTVRTVRDNMLKRLSSLYNKAVTEGKAPATTSFSRLQGRLTEATSGRMEETLSDGAFEKLQRLVRTPASTQSVMKQLGRDLLLFSVYLGGLTFEELASYRKDAYTGSNEQILEIVERYRRPRNRYLFPLGQSRSTPKQLERKVTALIGDALQSVGLRLSGTAGYTGLHLWLQVALRCGITASDIAACAGARSQVSALSAFAVASELSAEEIEAIRSRVLSTLTEDPLEWYAMHLRPHVDYGMLMRRLQERHIALRDHYYPLEEILLRIGRRKVFTRRPVIWWLVFFRARSSELSGLFHAIGDLAWGYRREKGIRSPYAVISPCAVRAYQEAIGTLSPSSELLSEESIRFEAGDRLVILGGAMHGREGVFVSERRIGGDGSTGSKTVYRVQLLGGQSANWIVDWDPRLVKKLPTPVASAPPQAV